MAPPNRPVGPAAFSVVPGPGILNAATALLTAMGGCAPVIGLTGQVPSQFLGKGRGHLHELPDQPATLQTFIKDALHVGQPADAPAIINRAFQTARSGRPGPVTVEMCWDTMAERGEVAIDSSLPPILKPEPDPDAIKAAAKKIAAASKPMIMCGAGAQHAADEVQALAELLNAPVTAFRSGRGIVPEDHVLGVPSVAARELFDEVDVLIGIGSRLEMPTMRLAGHEPLRAKARRRPRDHPHRHRLPLRNGPALPGHRRGGRLRRRLPKRCCANSRPWLRRIRTGSMRFAPPRPRADSAVEKVQPQVDYLRAIRDILPRDGFFRARTLANGFCELFRNGRC